MKIFFIIYFGIGLIWGLAIILSLHAMRSHLDGSRLATSKKQQLGILGVIFLWPFKIIAMITYNRDWAKHRMRYWKWKLKS